MLRLWTLTAFLLCMSVTAVIYQNCDSSNFHGPQQDSELTLWSESSKPQDQNLCDLFGGIYQQGTCSIDLYKPETSVHSRICQQLGGLWNSQRDPNCLFTLDYRHRYMKMFTHIREKSNKRVKHLDDIKELSDWLISQTSSTETEEPLDQSAKSHLIQIKTQVSQLQRMLNNLEPILIMSTNYKLRMNQIVSDLIDIEILIDQAIRDESAQPNLYKKIHSIQISLGLDIENYKAILKNFFEISSHIEEFYTSKEPSYEKVHAHISLAIAEVKRLRENSGLREDIIKNSLLPLAQKIEQEYQKTKVLSDPILAKSYQLAIVLDSLVKPAAHSEGNLISTFSQINILEFRLQRIESLGLTQDKLLPLSNSIHEDLSQLIQSLGQIKHLKSTEKISELTTYLEELREKVTLNKKSVMGFKEIINFYSGSLKKNLNRIRPILREVSEFDNQSERLYSYFSHKTEENCEKLGGHYEKEEISRCQFKLFKKLKWVFKKEEQCQATGELELSTSCPSGYKLIQCLGRKGAYIESNDLLNPQTNLQSSFYNNQCKLNIKNPACVSANKENSTKLTAVCAQWKGIFRCSKESYWNEKNQACENNGLKADTDSLCPKGFIMTFGKCVSAPDRGFHVPAGLCTKDNPLGFPSRCTCRSGFSYESESGLCLKDFQ